DSAGSRVKVGHRQAITAKKAPTKTVGAFFFAQAKATQKQKTKSASLETMRFFIGKFNSEIPDFVFG
ncbi:hypothetical protein, partial [Variovorax sp. CY25R-8]|uniref:hypothetical protein n=1 Tax=Variovorax sp. CY25R-8 TaxID=2855501 RepID=UPI0021BAE7FA